MDALLGTPLHRCLTWALALFALCLTPVLCLGSDSATGYLRSFGSHSERIAIKPLALHFKNVVAGQDYTQRVVITNVGHSPVLIANLRRNNLSFSIRGVKLPLRINPGKSAAVTIGLVPPRRGNLRTDFVFTTSRGSHLALSADGVRAFGGIVSNTINVNFGSVLVGAGASLPITLANSSSASQVISAVVVSGGEFGRTQVNLPMTLTPGESVTFGATFAPRWVGTAFATIIVDTNGSNLTISLAGQGARPGQFSVLPAQMNFGNVTAGANATLSGTLQASGSAITIYSAGITSPEFALTGLSFPMTMYPGQTKSYQVTFSPGATGNASATLSFQSSNGSLAQEVLSGNALPPAQHHVSLSWNPSSGVVGYNVYRANASSGPFSQLNSAPDSSSSFVDSTVQSSRTYYYVTTAIAANGSQSAFSNQVQVVIP